MEEKQQEMKDLVAGNMPVNLVCTVKKVTDVLKPKSGTKSRQELLVSDGTRDRYLVLWDSKYFDRFHNEDKISLVDCRTKSGFGNTIEIIAGYKGTIRLLDRKVETATMKS